MRREKTKNKTKQRYLNIKHEMKVGGSHPKAKGIIPNVLSKIQGREVGGGQRRQSCRRNQRLDKKKR